MCVICRGRYLFRTPRRPLYRTPGQSRAAQWDSVIVLLDDPQHTSKGTANAKVPDPRTVEARRTAELSQQEHKTKSPKVRAGLIGCPFAFGAKARMGVETPHRLTLGLGTSHSEGEGG